jgi:hypothetical protein
MAEYCITAANHKNPRNHVASSFLVWLRNEETAGWKSPGAKSARDVVGLVEAGHTVLTGFFNEKKKTITVGEPIEVELRISKNESRFDVNEMPTF